jgi:flagellar biosynthesis component FlhA
VDGITEILRLRIDEGVSIKDLAGILEAAVAVDGATSVDQSRYAVASPRDGAIRFAIEGEHEPEDVAEIVDCVRRSCPRLVSWRYVSSWGTLDAIRVATDIEARIVDVDHPLGEAERGRVLAAVRSAYATAVSKLVAAPVVVTNGQVRRRLRELAALEFPTLPILSFQEIPPAVKLKTAGWIDLTERG